MKNTVAIIPARGGSKRIPKKNIKDFLGKPMLSYAINACKESGIFSEVMVSTDNQEISDTAKNNGADVPFLRSEKTSDDYSTTYDVVEEVIREYRNINKHFEYICCVYPCVPFLSGNTLQKAFKLLLDSNSDALQPVCKFPVPIEWAMKIKEGILVPNDRKAQLIRSQDLEPKYFDVGMFYFCKTEILLNEKTIVPSKTIAYIMNEKEIQDIDTIEDWNTAELKYKLLKENK
ncbi:MAG: pseudaminic acid cytidylyltransferase [Treponema sp.]|nr:pseudaminic acid cytidylyltransferase [Treponema sp.]